MRQGPRHFNRTLVPIGYLTSLPPFYGADGPGLSYSHSPPHSPAHGWSIINLGTIANYLSRLDARRTRRLRESATERVIRSVIDAWDAPEA